ncbi:hypothetical protein C0J52_12344, partial [Blattella germanica]
AVRAKVDTVLSKNHAYEELRKVVAVLSDHSTVKANLDLSPADIVKSKNAPVASANVERIFSQYKSVLRDNMVEEVRPVFSKYCFASIRKSNLENASHVFHQQIHWDLFVVFCCDMSARPCDFGPLAGKVDERVVVFWPEQGLAFEFEPVLWPSSSAAFLYQHLMFSISIRIHRGDKRSL